jgi:hypothetical protein
MADRSTPEDDELQPKMVPGKTTGFLNNKMLNNLKNTATSRRLKARVLQAKNGTPHQQHVAHQQHMQHVQNQKMGNMKSKNPYNT